jgi:hypothetical protein
VPAEPGKVKLVAIDVRPVIDLPLFPTNATARADPDPDPTDAA